MGDVNNPGRRKEPGATASGDEHEYTLLRRVGAQDRAALEALYVLYHRRLARFLTRFIRDYSLAQEIINDTLFIVWQRAGDFRGGSRVSTWIMGIAYRRALKALRRASVRPQGTEGLENLQLTSPDEIEEAEQRQLLLQALQTLPLEQRLVLELTYYVGHSCEEIAAIMECPVNTVKTRMFHARRKLRARLPRLAGWPLESNE